MSHSLEQPTNNTSTSLRHRLPVRLRHHWKLLIAAIAVCLAIALAFGTSMVRPYITSELVSETVIVNDIDGDAELFDATTHTIDITFDQAEYEEMLSTFREDGEKEYIRADITIDGTLIEDVGLRLKGNSTLQSLSGNSMGGGEGGGPGGMTQLSEDNPEELPWLISFDEYEEGRAYQGMTEIALRPAASGSDVAINEALALELTAESGQVTQDYTFTSVTVNGSESAARIVVDTPDEQWADELGSGVLYKARAGGSLDYLGDDPTDYEDSFKQINAEGAYDLQPVMTLMKFLNESTDEEFAEELDDYVDTESFAKYLATQEILSNNDAMDGPGNNYYLWYDTTEKQFTVLSWDLNMALSGMMGGGGGMGGGMGGMQPDTNTQSEMPALPDDMEMPEGMEMPQMPQDGEMPGGGQMPGGDEREGAGPGGGSDSGILKERFLDNEEFYAMYEQAYSELYEQLIASGYAEETLNELATRAEEAGDEGATTVAESIRSSLASLSETAPQPSAGMGRPDQETTEDV
ncbi:CotH kinase family protein [Corynebacterium sp. J010B-136]|uniref:CotH kinase family protein n=1 Tax=Corynebacterium sp. J010B-136 TaxID=2099401 RepID=UPI000CF92755|nr:CotH kinase family protein [Corynebacterium sp. J010B-136]PQM74112.1 spore coat protein CotH [Corynebacterium sp. J010B-136]